MELDAQGISKGDVFALGSVLYFIVVGMEPYGDLKEEEVDNLFKNGQFPNVDAIACGGVIRGCWCGSLSIAEQVITGLNCIEWEDDTSAASVNV